MDTKYILTTDEVTLRRIIREEVERAKCGDRTCSRDTEDSGPAVQLGWIGNSEAQKHASRSTLQRWRQRGLLPFSKIGGLIYYRVADLEKLFERNLRGGD